MNRCRLVMLPVFFLSVAGARGQAPGFPPLETPRPAAADKAASPADKYVVTGFQLYVAREWDQAIESFTQAIKVDPRHTEALLLRGKTHQAKGDTRSALRDFGAAIKISPRGGDAFKAYLYRLQILEEKGDLDGALADIERARVLRPEEALVYITRGRLRSAKGNYDGALADFDKVISMAPRMAAAYDSRGMARMAKGDFEGAIADLNKAMEINPLQSSFVVHRGAARRAKGDLDGASADYDKAIVLARTWDQAGAQGYIQRGLLKLALGKDTEAQADFDAALKLDPSIEPSMRKSVEEEKAKKKQSAAAPTPL